MEPNPLLPSFPDLVLIVSIVLVVLVLLGVVLGVWLSDRSGVQNRPARHDNQDGIKDARQR